MLDIDALDINTLRQLNDYVHNKANSVHSDEGKTLAKSNRHSSNTFLDSSTESDNKNTSDSSSNSSSFDDLDWNKYNYF